MNHVNQVKQLYVAKTYKGQDQKLTLADNESGDISLCWTKPTESVTLADSREIYFRYRGATEDSLLRSDRIDKCNILWISAISADNLKEKLKTCTVKLLDAALDDDGNPVCGQDYILRIAFKKYVGMSDEDQHFKYGVVHATKGMTTSDFYKVLAISLAKNFSRENQKLLTFKLGDTEVTSKTTLKDLESVTAEGVTITEYPQPWRRGIILQQRVEFAVLPGEIYNDGDEHVTWGQGYSDGADGVGLLPFEEGDEIKYWVGRRAADLEWFAMGERGDQYRQIFWPDNIDTAYMVDPTKDYDYLTIHYSFIGSNESSQKSERDLIIIAEEGGCVSDIFNDVKSAVEDYNVEIIDKMDSNDVNPVNPDNPDDDDCEED